MPNAQHPTSNVEFIKAVIRRRVDRDMPRPIGPRFRISAPLIIMPPALGRRLRRSDFDVERWTLGVGRFLFLPR